MAYKILVVDDEKLIVKGIKFSLQQDGMEVEAAYDGEEALPAGKRIFTGSYYNGDCKRRGYGQNNGS